MRDVGVSSLLLGLVLLKQTRNSVAAGPEDCVPHVPTESLEISSDLNCTIYRVESRPDISPGAMEQWTPSGGWTKRYHSPARYSAADARCLYASPGKQTIWVAHLDAGEKWREGKASWTYIAQHCPGELDHGGCWPKPCNRDRTPKDGSLRYYEISKCERLIWYEGSNISVLTDPDGNQYIMHAARTERVATRHIPAPATWPEGWVLETRPVGENETLEVIPDPPDSEEGEQPSAQIPVSFGNFACGYVTIEDSAGNAFRRFRTTTGSANIVTQLHRVWRRNLVVMISWISGLAAAIVVVALLCIFCRVGGEEYRDDPTESGIVDRRSRGTNKVTESQGASAELVQTS